jgi:hypothetical protein
MSHVVKQEPIENGSPEVVLSNNAHAFPPPPTTISSDATSSITFVTTAAEPAESDDMQKKRVALAGQWRTPPTPFFAGRPMEAAAEVPAATTTITVPIIEEVIAPPSLPHSTEDYAKALQEAYRRGAEAAARAAALAHATSCPDFMEVAAPASVMAPPPAPTIATAASFPPTHPQSVHSSSSSGSAGMVPMDTTTGGGDTLSGGGGVQVVHHHHHHHILPPETAHTSVASMPRPPSAVSQVSSTHPPPIVIQSKVATTTTQQQRSVSLPDMSSYAAQQEEEKRQKRLARNRASARLRRLRKKNLVDAYEVEVGSLEKTLAQLQQHEWGSLKSSSAALAEALSMDRGQQKLSVTERHQAATDILQQQLQFIEQLEELMQEQFVLHQVAQATLQGSSDHEWKDLQETLQLSPDQCQQIMDQSTGWQEEWNSLQTVKTSLQAMKENNWLWNEGCSAITDQFLSILHSNQISEAIEELDGLHAIPVVADAPVFQFGMDNNPNAAADGMDEEKATA